MNIRTPLIASCLIASTLISGAAHAALQGRDLNGSAGNFEAYYDTDLKLYLTGEISVTAVPEPESWAMLLAGLGLVGVAARRRHG